MKKVHAYFIYFREECPAAVLCGVLMASLFGIFLVLERFFPNVSKELFFLRYPEIFRFGLGVFLCLFSVLSFWRPLVFGLLTTYIICFVRVIDSVQLQQYIRMGIWIIIAICATWGLFRKYTLDKQRKSLFNELFPRNSTIPTEPSIEQKKIPQL